ncbi:MAG: hypothetical protein HFI93_10970 [Lachnospiraceae bacterium]|nr:hypothetical protein [Lachnospiraceae bacterium]
MEIDRRKKNPHRAKLTIDMIHVLICVAIIVLAVFGFADPRENMKLFSAVFVLASALNFMNGILRLRQRNGRKKPIVSGIFLCILGIFLLGLAILSAVVFW